MKTQQTQELRLQQKLAPMQVQYVRMLEMTTPEIEDAVRRMVEDNPAIEVTDAPEVHQLEQSVSDDANDYDEAYRPQQRKSASDWIPEVATDSTDETLALHLERQLSELDLDRKTRGIALYLIGEIDGNGRMTRSPHEIADDIAFNTGADVCTEDVAKAADIIRTLDPPGVGAADLRICLLLQLQRNGRNDQTNADAIRLLESHYDLYSRRRFDLLASVTGLSQEQLRDADKLIRGLNPKPGAQFAGGDRMERASSVVVPDFNLEIDDNDNITVSLTSDLPELAIAESFKATDGNSDEFIRHHRDEALGTMRLLEMRARTLLRTMKAIAYLQRDFFLTEERENIRPMVLRDIAKITGDDLSVISRATAGKYVNTPGGVYPLKMFFSEHTASDSSGNGSLHKVLETLRKIIDTEDKKEPYTDDALCEIMRKRGFMLARRTVAKYREEKLGIPVARLRRKV